MEIGNKSKVEFKGTHIISLCDARKEGAQNLIEKIEEVSLRRQHLIRIGLNTFEAMHDLWLEYCHYLKRLHRKFKTQEFVVENITTTVGRTAIANRMGGSTTYTGIVNYTAVGDDNTAAIEADATLGNETSRKALSSGTNSNATVFLETFFAAAEAVDTHEEFAMFIDGTGSADTGQMVNRFTQTVTKSNTETMNVQSQIALSDA